LSHSDLQSNSLKDFWAD
jgi:hypothetical protein